MPSIQLLPTIVRELFVPGRLARQPEPSAAMNGAAQVAAYAEAGREGGVMAAAYLFHSANVCEVVRPGDVVVDLACGPANQLVQLARLNPDSRFIGVDLSSEMRASALALVKASGLRNVELRSADMTNLSAFDTGSVDVVVSSMALHHLPEVEQLRATFHAIARVLRPGGGFYVSDFARLRHEASMRRFAHKYADRVPELFTCDYVNSLRAAFTADDIAHAATALPDARVFRARSRSPSWWRARATCGACSTAHGSKGCETFARACRLARGPISSI